MQAVRRNHDLHAALVHPEHLTLQRALIKPSVLLEVEHQREREKASGHRIMSLTNQKQNSWAQGGRGGRGGAR